MGVGMSWIESHLHGMENNPRRNLIFRHRIHSSFYEFRKMAQGNHPLKVFLHLPLWLIVDAKHIKGIKLSRILS